MIEGILFLLELAIYLLEAIIWLFRDSDRSRGSMP